MKDKTYIIFCPECEEDVFKGSILECENWAKKNGLGWIGTKFLTRAGYFKVKCKDCLDGVPPQEKHPGLR